MYITHILLIYFAITPILVEGIYRSKILLDRLEVYHNHFQNDVDEKFPFPNVHPLYIAQRENKLVTHLHEFINNSTQMDLNSIEAEYRINFEYRKTLDNMNQFDQSDFDYYSDIYVKVNNTLSNSNNIIKRGSQENVTDIFLYWYSIMTKTELIRHYIYRKMILIGRREKLDEMKDFMKSSKTNYKTYLKACQETYLTKASLLSSNRTIPKLDKKDYTYVTVTELLQGFIQNENSLNEKGSCWKKCDDYSGISGRNPTNCEKRRCNGKLRDCRFLSKKFRVCPSGGNSDRRYEYITGDGHTWGKATLCPNNECMIERWASWFSNCDYCFCMCDSNNKIANKYFSLRPVVSDVEANKVITGVQLIKQNHIFQFKIQEAYLESYGRVKTGTWNNSDAFAITDNGVTTEDYHELTYENRRIDLESVRLPNEFVVTGVKFVVKEGALKVSVQGTKLNLKTGELDGTTSHWFQNSLAENRIINDELDVPVEDRKNVKNKLRQIFSTHNKYVMFTNTGLEQDAAQTTVPFLETLPVTEKMVPLQGLGLYHKNTEGYGGFIAPLIMSYSNSKVVDVLLEELNS